MYQENGWHNPNWKARLCENLLRKNIFSWLNKQLPQKKWKHETTRVTARPSPPLVSVQKQLPRTVLKSSCSKTSQNSIGNTCGGSVLAAGHIPSYLQKLNCGTCYSWNFSKYLWLIAVTKSSHWGCSIEKSALKKFKIFIGKHLCWSLF